MTNRQLHNETRNPTKTSGMLDLETKILNGGNKFLWIRKHCDNLKQNPSKYLKDAEKYLQRNINIM